MTRWRHVGRSTTYTEIGRAELQASGGPVEEGAILVVYQGEDGKLWARPVSEFEDGRFILEPDSETRAPAPEASDDELMTVAELGYCVWMDDDEPSTVTRACRDVRVEAVRCGQAKKSAVGLTGCVAGMPARMASSVGGHSIIRGWK